MEGRKNDNGKLEFHLMPTLAEEEVVRVLMVGAKKYEEENWRKVPNASVRYWDACKRHMNKYKQGVIYDEEDGFHHLAHAACCMLFIADLDLTVRTEPKTIYFKEEKASLITKELFDKIKEEIGGKK